MDSYELRMRAELGALHADKAGFIHTRDALLEIAALLAHEDSVASSHPRNTDRLPQKFAEFEGV